MSAEQTPDAPVEVEYLETTSSPRMLAWFLGSLSGLLFLSVFYVGDIISTGYYQILSYRDFVNALEVSDRPDHVITPVVLKAFPDEQAKMIRRVGDIYSLIYKGETDRAEQILLGESIPELPTKYRLAAILSWITENKRKVEQLQVNKNTTEQKRKDFIRAFNLDEQHKFAEESLDAQSVFPAMLTFDNSIGRDILAFFVPAKQDKAFSLALISFYNETLATHAKQSELLEQSSARQVDLFRMAKEKTKTLLTQIALPQFDERTGGVYREASLHSQSLGITLPQIKDSTI